MESLLLSSFTAARRTFRELTEACAGAGVDAVALVALHHDQFIANGETDADMVAAIRESGVRVLDVEGVGGVLRPPSERRRQTAERLFTLAETLGAETVATLSDYDGDLATAAARLAQFCDDAAARGLGVLVEPVPGADLLDPATAWQIIERSERENVGLVLDTWHLYRGGLAAEALRSIPARAFWRVQISDGALRPVEGLSYAEETRRYRRLPGDGELDLVGVIRTLDDIGAEPVWAVEVLSETLDQLPGDEAARRAAETTRALLQKARRR